MNTPVNPVTRAEVIHLEQTVAGMRVELADARRAAADTHAMVQALHQALMRPSPGQERSLLDRMAEVTISIESGGQVSGLLIKLAASLAAIGSLWAAIKHGWL